MNMRTLCNNSREIAGVQSFSVVHFVRYSWVRCVKFVQRSLHGCIVTHHWESYTKRCRKSQICRCACVCACVSEGVCVCV